MRFMGIPGEPAVVTVLTRHGTRTLQGDFGWGKKDPRAGALALAVLKEHLRDEGQAVKLYRRFLWRTFGNYRPDQPWQLTGEEIDEVLTSIKETDKQFEGQRRQAGYEAGPVANEGGIGPGGVPFSKIERKS